MDINNLTDAQLDALIAQKEDPHVAAIHSIESGGASAAANPVNPASGARSSMQMMPASAGKPGFGVAPSNGTPVDDTRTGVQYYQTLRDRYKDPVKAAVAYDWGPGNADKWIADGADIHKLPPETLDYVIKFMEKQPKQQPAAAPAQTGLPPGATEINPQIVQEGPAPDTPNYTIGGRIQQGILDILGGAGRAALTGLNKLSPSKTVTDTLAQTDANTAAREAEFARKTQAAGGDPNATDWYRVGGQTLPSFLIPGGATSFGGRILEGAAQGALQSAALTKPGESYTDTMTRGGAVGGATSGLLGVAGRVIRGADVAPEVKALAARGVTPTPGQTLGGVVGRVEEKAEVVPGLGDAIISARRAATEDANRAMYQEVLAPIGGTAPREVGRDAVDAVSQQVDDAYNRLMPYLRFQRDAQFGQDLAGIRQQVARRLSPENQRQFTNILEDTVGINTRGGQAVGREAKDIESGLNKEIRDLSGGNMSPDDRRLRDALQTTLAAFRSGLARQNPAQAQELAAANTAYGNLRVLQTAAEKVNDPHMPIKPGQMQAAVRQQSKQVSQAGFARGNARMQETSDAMATVLSDRYPNSGTAGRLITGGLLTGGIGSMVSPVAAGVGLGAAGLYATQAGRRAMYAAIARRPELARQLGAGMQALGPNVGAALAGQYKQE
jgi:Transglycosylase SLT domain